MRFLNLHKLEILKFGLGLWLYFVGNLQSLSSSFSYALYVHDLQAHVSIPALVQVPFWNGTRRFLPFFLWFVLAYWFLSLARYLSVSLLDISISLFPLKCNLSGPHQGHWHVNHSNTELTSSSFFFLWFGLSYWFLFHFIISPLATWLFSAQCGDLRL